MKSLINNTISKIAISSAIAISTVGISTGIIPITAKIANQEVSNIEVAEAQCTPYHKVHYAWWGVYVYLNQCAANKLAYYGTNTAVGGTVITALRGSVPGSVVATAIQAYPARLAYCADNYGQAYLKYKPLSWGFTYEVSCR